MRQLVTYRSNIYVIRCRSTFELIEVDAISYTIEERVVYAFRNDVELICSYNVYHYDIIDVKHGKGKYNYSR